jgi:hypothetical protein
VQHRFSKSNFEDTPMAVTKKSISENSTPAKTTPTKSPKAPATTAVVPSTMKTAFRTYSY